MPCFCALCSRDAESAKLRLLLVVVVVVCMAHLSHACLTFKLHGGRLSLLQTCYTHQDGELQEASEAVGGDMRPRRQVVS